MKQETYNYQSTNVSCIVELTFGSETLSLPFATPRASHCFNNEPRRLTILTKVKGQRADQRARNCLAFYFRFCSFVIRIVLFLFLTDFGPCLRIASLRRIISQPRISNQALSGPDSTTSKNPSNVPVEDNVKR